MSGEVQPLRVLVVKDGQKEWLSPQRMSRDELITLVRGIAGDAKKEGVHWTRRWIR